MKTLKFATLPFKTDIPQAVAFLGTASSIRESMSASDKSSNFESAEAMMKWQEWCVEFTPRLLLHDKRGCFVTTQYHVVQIAQSENGNSYSV